METRRNILTLVTVGVVVLGGLRLSLAQYGGGTGAPNDPYQIWTAEQMNAIGADPNDWDKHFKLMADIDLSAYEANAIRIIGSYGGRSAFRPFRGVFDGDGHTIANFTRNSADDYSVGLFGFISGFQSEIKNLRLLRPALDAGAGNSVGALVGYLMDGTIRNCQVTEGSITGGDRIGGLVGHLESGTIADCCVEGATVTGDSRVGGLVGGADYWGASISRCYATAAVIGNDYVGGLVATNGGRITHCYASGTVSGTDMAGGLVGHHGEGRGGTLAMILNCYSTTRVGGGTYIGGLVGYGRATVVDSFWDIEASGQLTSAGGMGFTTARMQMATTFRAWGDPNNAGVWTIDEGHDYPRLAWEDRPGLPIVGSAPSEPIQLADVIAGAGTSDDPYLIYTAEELSLVTVFPSEWDKHFKLMADLDLTPYAGGGLARIGSSKASPFSGVFDGNGHTIANYVHTSAGSSYAGLFGYVSPPRTIRGKSEKVVIKNLGLIDPIVDGRTANYTGVLVGYMESGTITGCYVRGGLVSGSGITGGLVGRGIGNITDCYARIAVIGDDYAGGLVGSSGLGTVVNCYSTGTVSGDHAGGLVGSSGAQGVSESFWDIETSGLAANGGGTGLTTAEMQTSSTFLGAGWDLIGESDNGIEDIWWILEGQDYPRLWWELPGEDALVFAVDDFEDYNDAPGYEIFAAWVDPYINRVNGVMVGHMVPPYAEQTIVHGGAQSMPLYYDNTDGVYNSWAIRSFYPAQDWTIDGAVALVLWFRGVADNGIDAFYLTVEDSAGKRTTCFNPDPNAVVADRWTPWLISSNDLAAGVNIRRIARLEIGVGDQAKLSQNARGILYIDDIGLVRRP